MLELVPLRIGHSHGPEALMRRGARWRIASFPAGAALIRCRAGDVLFDTGYGAAYWCSTGGLPERLHRWLAPAELPDRQRLASQLCRMKVTPVLVILSHLHSDHVAGLFDLAILPPVVTSRPAFAALSRGGRLSAVLAGCPEPLRRRIRALDMRFVEDCPQVEDPPDGLAGFGRIHDVMGDGSILSVPLPGHGQGQFGLFLPRSMKGPQFLIADAAVSRAALRGNAPPPDFMLKRLGDRDAYHKTFTRLRDLMAARPEITFWPSHCAQAYP